MDVFDQWANPEGSKLRRFQKWATSRLGFSPPIVVGRALKTGLLKRWFGVSWGIMPIRMPVHRPLTRARTRTLRLPLRGRWRG